MYKNNTVDMPVEDREISSLIFENVFISQTGRLITDV